VSPLPEYRGVAGLQGDKRQNVTLNKLVRYLWGMIPLLQQFSVRVLWQRTRRSLLTNWICSYFWGGNFQLNTQMRVGLYLALLFLKCLQMKCCVLITARCLN